VSPHVRDGAFAAGIFLGCAAGIAGLWWLGDRIERRRIKRRLKQRR
jgi:hypothetical protein